ncbi:hypothetical protein D0C37_04180 [Streptomyces koyangensis]|uniref:Uncharacterized protein n=1 Tax=Streptomyces koyangensis TaxID=188770 RepID=A0A385D7F2_9ACTN|nr:hypothetical protein D0C37_04180 [Streptomyces koyangensis]
MVCSSRVPWSKVCWIRAWSSWAVMMRAARSRDFPFLLSLSILAPLPTLAPPVPPGAATSIGLATDR